MLLTQNVKRGSRIVRRYQSVIDGIVSSPGSARLRGLFGSDFTTLPQSLLAELVSLDLQRRIAVRDRLDGYGQLGRHLLNFELNARLGTADVSISPALYMKFATEHNVADILLCPQAGSVSKAFRAQSAAQLVARGVGAAHLHLGTKATRRIVADRIVGGPHGLAQLFLQQLGFGH